MSQLYHNLFPAMWLAWLAYWLWASRGNKAIARHESVASRLLHLLPLLLSFYLLWAEQVPVQILNERLLPLASWVFWLGALITACGQLFAVWARQHIGRNWSGTVTIKHEHELVTTGPYAWIRHPIYTGLLLAIAGSALARGEWRGVLAVLIAWLALWRKLRLEERWMREMFGAQYEDYARRVPGLIPFSRRQNFRA